MGQKYGMWTVIGEGDKQGSTARWKVKCDCGEESQVRVSLLRKGKAVKCVKCRNSGEYVQRHRNANWRGYGKLGMTEYNSMVKRAKTKGHEVNVSIEDLARLFEEQGEKCALTGIPLVLWTKKGNASIDRIDSKKGYIKGNVQWVDKRVNMMKNAIPEAEFVELCRLIYLKQENKICGHS